MSHRTNCKLSMTALASLAIATMLCACGQSSPPAAGAGVSAAPVTEGTPQADVQTREAQVAQREAEVAKREAEIAAKEQEEARRQAEADAAAQAAADAAAAKKAAAAAKKAAAPVKKPAVVASSSAPPKPMPPPPPPRPVEQLVQVPGGTALNVALSSDMSSKTARPGDTFVATLSSNLSINGRVAVPTGTRVSGTITDVISGSRAIGATPTLGLQFNQLELEDGQVIPITGELVQTGQSEKVRDTAKILGGVAAGAVLGHQVKTNNRGKVIGGLLGGAIGAVAAKKTGTEVELPAGSTLTLTTAEPFTVKVRDPNAP